MIATRGITILIGWDSANFRLVLGRETSNLSRKHCRLALWDAAEVFPRARCTDEVFITDNKGVYRTGGRVWDSLPHHWGNPGGI